MTWSDHVIVTADKWRAMCAVVGCCSFVVGILVTLAAYVYMKYARVKNKVITILDSPPPTRSARDMSSASHKHMSETFRVRRRGGRRRHGTHRRTMTRVYDPPAKDDCGFACVLRAARVSCTKKNIRELRTQVADRVYKGYLSDEHYYGYSVRDMVQQSDHTLAAYRASLEWDMWAYLVKLADQHWTLHAIRRTFRGKEGSQHERGGMQPQSTASSAQASTWTWENAMPNTVSILSLPPAATTIEVAEEVPAWAIPINAPPGLLPQEKDAKIAKEQVSPTLRTDVSALAMVVRTTLLPQGLRQRLSEILLIPAERLTLHDVVGDSLKEHLGLPDEVQVRDAWQKHTAVYDILDVSIAGQDRATFNLKIDQTWTHGQLVRHPAKIVDKHDELLETLDLTGKPWRYPEDRVRTSTIVVRTLPPSVHQVDLLGYMGEQRGGARTISTTMPCTGEGEDGDETANPDLVEEHEDTEEHAHPEEGEGNEEAVVHEENEALRNDIRDISNGIMHVLDMERDNRVIDRRDFVRARQLPGSLEGWSTRLQKGH